MVNIKIKFNSPNDIKEFVGITSKLNCDLDVKYGSAITVDGKSIGGLFSIPLNNELSVIAHGSCENEVEDKIAKFKA